MVSNQLGIARWYCRRLDRRVFKLEGASERDQNPALGFVGLLGSSSYWGSCSDKRKESPPFQLPRSLEGQPFFGVIAERLTGVSSLGTRHRQEGIDGVNVDKNSS